MGVGSAGLAGRGRSVGVSPSFVATDFVIAYTSLLSAMCFKLIYHFVISLMFDGSRPSALLTEFAGSLVLSHHCPHAFALHLLRTSTAQR